MRAGRGLTLTWHILAAAILLVVPTYLVLGEAAWMVGRGRVPGVFGVPFAYLLSGVVLSIAPGLTARRAVPVSVVTLATVLAGCYLTMLLRFWRTLYDTGGMRALLVLHLGYHFLFLGQFPEHRALMQHWTQTADQRELLDWLDDDERRGAVLLAEEDYIGYLPSVYSPLRAWHSHLFNTPWSHERRHEARPFSARVFSWKNGTALDC